VIEFLPELKADKVLQDRLKTLDNVTVVTNAATQEITGDSTVNGITYADRDSNEITHLEVAGVFILIGLVPNTQWLSDTIECNK
ncbi:FAD-dependent oxidoreductase, partial [Clostridium tepidum]